MHLAPHDAALFYKLMHPLQYYVNQQLQILPQITSLEEWIQIGSATKLPVRDALYKHLELLDTFIAENPAGLCQDELALVASWQHCVADDFFIERFLKKYSIWIGSGNPAPVYGVLGITEGLDEMIHKSYLPLRVKSILLPFQGRIIYDGLLQSYNIVFGRGIKADLSETYMVAKQHGRIIESLEPQAQATPQLTPVSQRDWRPALEELMHGADKLKAQQVPIQSEAFSLIKASIRLAQAAAQDLNDLDALWKEQKGVQRALQKLETALHRAER
jgi:hypothetical protein